MSCPVVRSRGRRTLGEDVRVLNEIEGRALDAAETLAASLPGDDAHTVAAAAMDADGGIHTGVNVFHFTGGPCAELVAIGAAAAAGAGPLVTMVAVGDRGRGVMAPCGRCRQVLLDLHPDVRVIVPGESGLVAKPVRGLLPYSYSPTAAGISSGRDA
jgi:cytidine deaminase